MDGGGGSRGVVNNRNIEVHCKVHKTLSIGKPSCGTTLEPEEEEEEALAKTNSN